MIIPDLINGLYEGTGGFMNLLNVKQLLKDKKVSGVRLLPSAFFSSWGVWNLYYYPHLGQWLSFAGGLFIVLVNFLWLGLAVYYRRRDARRNAEVITSNRALGAEGDSNS